jgi:hypothetical protein
MIHINDDDGDIYLKRYIMLKNPRNRYLIRDARLGHVAVHDIDEVVRVHELADAVVKPNGLLDQLPLRLLNSFYDETDDLIDFLEFKNLDLRLLLVAAVLGGEGGYFGGILDFHSCYSYMYILLLYLYSLFYYFTTVFYCYNFFNTSTISTTLIIPNIISMYI